MIRTFLAIELSSELHTALTTLQQKLQRLLTYDSPFKESRSPIQWVNPKSIHLTLKFLGDIDESKVSSIQQAIDTIGKGHGPFSVNVQGMGAFPNFQYPRVLWVGFSGNIEPLQLLAQEVEQALEPLGFAREERPFTPHLTLARVKGQSRKVGAVLTAQALRDLNASVGSLAVTSLALMKSDLTPAGARYTRLGQGELSGTGIRSS